MGEYAGRWLRVSTGGQDEDNQVPDISRWIEAHDYEVRTSYVLHGRSASKGEQQAALDQMLADMRCGLITVLVVWRDDRIERRGVLHMVPLINAVTRGGRADRVRHPAAAERPVHDGRADQPGRHGRGSARGDQDQEGAGQDGPGPDQGRGRVHRPRRVGVRDHRPEVRQDDRADRAGPPPGPRGLRAGDQGRVAGHDRRVAGGRDGPPVVAPHHRHHDPQPGLPGRAARRGRPGHLPLRGAGRRRHVEAGGQGPGRPAEARAHRPREPRDAGRGALLPGVRGQPDVPAEHRLLPLHRPGRGPPRLRQHGPRRARWTPPWTSSSRSTSRPR